MLSKQAVGLREDRLVTMLERLLELPTQDVNSTLAHTTQLVAEVLAADMVQAFLHDTATDALVAADAVDLPLELRPDASAIHQLPLVNGGHLAEVFLSGVPYLSGHIDQDSEDIVGMQSEIATIFQVGTQHRGVLLASSSQPEFFSEQDLHFLQAVAGWVGIMIHRAELVKRMRQEAVEQGRRLAAEELLTIMAHDLRNYLTPLKGRLELIEQRAQREGREQDLYDVIAASTTFHRLERVIADLLDVARLNQGIFTIHPQCMDLVRLVYEVVPAFGGPETPIYVHTPQKAMLSGDPDRLRQVLENLLANASKYAPKHTPINVQVGRERRRDGPWIVLTVSNEGPGLPAEVSAQCLRPFSAGGSSTGLGLGLYLANRIAEAHYGTLTVESAAGQGVRVTLGLPVEEEEADEGTRDERNGPGGSFHDLA